MSPGIRAAGFALAVGCLWVEVGRACSCAPSLPLRNAERAEVMEPNSARAEFCQ
jgi:hypothetical protein